MAYNSRKILDVLKGELRNVPERCDGYHEDINRLLADVLNLERDHMLAKTHIVKKIGDQVNKVGMSLHRNRPDNGTDRKD